MDTKLRLLRLLFPLASAIAVAAFPIAVAAASVSTTYSLSGYEYYATSTQGRFAGWAGGSAGDNATWNAVVDHTPLTSSASITGGSASLLTTNLVYIHGSFTAGSVALDYQAPGCGVQRYSVRGTLTDVTRSDSSAVGTAIFTATLTHYRVSVFGYCTVYSAGVSGSMSLAF